MASNESPRIAWSLSLWKLYEILQKFFGFSYRDLDQYSAIQYWKNQQGARGGLYLVGSADLILQAG